MPTLARAVGARQQQELRVADPAGGEHDRLRRRHGEPCAARPSRARRSVSAVSADRAALASSADDRAAERDVDRSVEARSVGAELLGEPRRRLRRHRPVDEARDERRLVADERRQVIEDRRGPAPVRQQRAWAIGQRHADRRVVEVERRRDRAPAGPRVRGAAQRAHPVLVPVAAGEVAVADAVPAGAAGAAPPDSITSTRRPAAPSAVAKVSPAGPEPTTTAS